MNEIQNIFDQIVNNSNRTITILDFSVNLILTAILGWLLGAIYVRFGNSLSNRKSLTTTLLLVSMTTMIIISVVQSSLALSLGLVGALSIIRFRTAIKEPEELAYFFIAISVGLGFGANQKLTTIVGFCILVLVIFAKSRGKEKTNVQNLIINLNSSNHNPSKDDVNFIVGILKRHCVQIELKRFDEMTSSMEMSFFIELKSFEKLLEIRQEINQTYKDISVSFIESR